MKNYIKNFINKNIIYISIIISVFILLYSLYYVSYSECNSLYENGHEVNCNNKQIIIFFILYYIFCFILYFVINYLLKIKYFIDKYLLSSTIIFYSIFLPIYSPLASSKIYNVFSIIIFIVSLFLIFISVKNNYIYYKTIIKIFFYLFAMFNYMGFIYFSCCVYGLLRCVGGCL